MSNVRNEKLFKLVATAVFAAIVILLQLTLGLITVSTINLNFVLIPIVLAGILFGALSGTIAGTAFGITVFIQCMTGAQAFGYVLFAINPFYTFIACVGRGALVGLLPALIYKGLSGCIKNKYISTLLTSLSAPVLNTGIFLLCYATLFNGHMHELMTGEGAGVMYVLFILLAGVNFIFEFVTSGVIIPPVAVVLDKVKNAKG